MAKRVILAGGSGFLGRALAEALHRRGYDTAILSRRPSAKPDGSRWREWDGKTTGPWADELEGAAAVVNLTGRSVNCLPTTENKQEIIESRVDSVRAINAAIAQCRTPPPVIVQAGSLAIYGDAGDRVCDEQAPHGEGFSVEVCERWEAALAEAKDPRVRHVVLRIGFALGRDGGALGPLTTLARRFLGGTVGDGRQYISWLHIDDLVAMFIAGIERGDLSGVYNATGPSPVTNRDFMRDLRHAVGRPWSPPVPKWAVHIGARFIMRTDPSLALTGRRCVPRRFEDQGFVFRYRELPEALREIFSQQGAKGRANRPR